jgi:hypothetical protein
MKIVNGLIFSILIASATSASAAPLDEKSKMLDWGHATPDEKNVWIANFKFKQPDIDRAEVAECLENAFCSRFLKATISWTSRRCAEQSLHCRNDYDALITAPTLAAVARTGTIEIFPFRLSRRP